MIEILATYGVCFGLMNDKFPLVRRARRLRVVDAALSCAYCAGFHSGWLVRLLVLIPDRAHISMTHALVDLLTWGFVGAGACYVLDGVARAVDSAAEGDA